MKNKIIKFYAHIGWFANNGDLTLSITDRNNFSRSIQWFHSNSKAVTKKDCASQLRDIMMEAFQSLDDGQKLVFIYKIPALQATIIHKEGSLYTLEKNNDFDFEDEDTSRSFTREDERVFKEVFSGINFLQK